MAKLVRMAQYPRISEFERGRRIPSMITLLYYARIAGIPLEYIVDDDIDMDAFRGELIVGQEKRGEETREDIISRVSAFWTKVT